MRRSSSGGGRLPPVESVRGGMTCGPSVLTWPGPHAREGRETAVDPCHANVVACGGGRVSTNLEGDCTPSYFLCVDEALASPKALFHFYSFSMHGCARVCVGLRLATKRLWRSGKIKRPRMDRLYLLYQLLVYYIQFVLLVYQPPANNIFRTTYHHQSLGINRLALLFFLTANQHHPPTISQTNKTESSSWLLVDL
jgi:hypothetical protein